VKLVLEYRDTVCAFPHKEICQPVLKSSLSAIKKILFLKAVRRKIGSAPVIWFMANIAGPLISVLLIFIILILVSSFIDIKNNILGIE
jgi:hypothetical protein